MKKLYTIGLGLLACVGMNAQSANINELGQQTEIQSEQIEGWYNYGHVVYQKNNENPYYRTYLYPDSNVRITYPGGHYNAWTHSFGQVFDPTSENWVYTESESLMEENTYSIDSIALPYSYYRPQTANNDELIIQFYKHSKIELGDWGGADAPTYGTVAYNSSTNLGADADLTINYELTDLDTSKDDISYLYFPVDLELGADEVFAVTYTYVPGNEVNDNDTIDYWTEGVVNEVNAFVVFYYLDTDQTVENGYYNNNLLIFTTVRYDNGGDWNGKYLTGYGFNDGYAQSDVNFKMRSLNVGIEEQPQSLNYLFNNVVEGGESVRLTEYLEANIYDAAGKLVLQVKGNTLNTSSLNAGLYFVEIINNDVKTVERLLVK